MFYTFQSQSLQVDAITKEEATGSQLLYNSIRIAECLSHYGIKAGDSVGICSENRIEYVYIIYGALMIGATVSPISNDFGESKFNFLSYYNYSKSDAY